MGKTHTLVGYHGTTSGSAETILSTKVFRDSTKKHDWLGKGVYFFAYKADAIAWAQRQVQKPKNAGQSASVLSSRLEFNNDQLLDLDDPAGLEAMHNVLKKIGHVVEKHISADCTTQKGVALWKQWYLNCEVYKRLNPNIGVIIYTFRFPNIFAEEYFSRNQRQICVSDHSIIKSIVREGLS